MSATNDTPAQQPSRWLLSMQGHILYLDDAGKVVVGAHRFMLLNTMPQAPKTDDEIMVILRSLAGMVNMDVRALIPDFDTPVIEGSLSEQGDLLVVKPPVEGSAND